MDTDRQRFQILFTETRLLCTAQNIFFTVFTAAAGAAALGGQGGARSGAPHAKQRSAVADATKERGFPAWRGHRGLTDVLQADLPPKSPWGFQQSPSQTLGPRSQGTARCPPGLSPPGAGRAWPPSSHGRIRPQRPSPSPGAAPSPGRAAEAEAASGTFGAGAAPLQTPQHSSHLCRVTQDRVTQKGRSRALGQLWSPPSTAGASQQPPHF